MTTAEVVGDWGPWLGIDPETRKRTVVAEPVWYAAGDAERAVLFQPGYRTDRRTFGRHGMDVTWLLRGGLGVTQLKVFTGWDPGLNDMSYERVHAPIGADLGYHALCPQYEGQDAMDCDLLPGESRCFYDGSGMAATDLLRRFLIEGEDVIWRTLGEWHDRLVAPADGGAS